jgi:hypothetical protein
LMLPPTLIFWVGGFSFTFKNASKMIQITWLNYREVLPENLHERFRRLANSRYATTIVYHRGAVRYADVDEAHELRK